MVSSDNKDISIVDNRVKRKCKACHIIATQPINFELLITLSFTNKLYVNQFDPFTRNKKI